jgi:hypothetical protein
MNDHRPDVVASAQVGDKVAACTNAALTKLADKLKWARRQNKPGLRMPTVTALMRPLVMVILVVLEPDYVIR